MAMRGLSDVKQGDLSGVSGVHVSEVTIPKRRPAGVRASIVARKDL